MPAPDGLPLRMIELGRNTGFAFAANRGLEAASAPAVALVNTDVVLAPDWIERTTNALARDDRRRRGRVQDGPDGRPTAAI